jgi:uncharacterized protein DUF6931
MSRLRFATAREVFEAFPRACEDIRAAPTDDPPLTYIQSLAATETPEDAIAFCAYLLPRREAVWWACQCVRWLDRSPRREELAALDAAEAWVVEPNEQRRRAALELGLAGDRGAPASCLALAAGCSGGSAKLSDEGVPAPPDTTAKMACTAVLAVLARVGAKDRAVYLKGCIEAALRLAGEDARPPF